MRRGKGPESGGGDDVVVEARCGDPFECYAVVECVVEEYDIRGIEN